MLRIYELYKGPKGVTPNSQVYSLPSKQIWQVAAVSIKQAVYLAANDIWREERKGTGIVGYTPHGGDHQWERDDETQSWIREYKHYQQVPKEER